MFEAILYLVCLRMGGDRADRLSALAPVRAPDQAIYRYKSRNVAGPSGPKFGRILGFSRA